jgi:hypothetical protein
MIKITIVKIDFVIFYLKMCLKMKEKERPEFKTSFSF